MKHHSSYGLAVHRTLKGTETAKFLYVFMGAVTGLYLVLVIDIM